MDEAGLDWKSLDYIGWAWISSDRVWLALDLILDWLGSAWMIAFGLALDVIWIGREEIG